jgi:hypothetical protein
MSDIEEGIAAPPAWASMFSNARPVERREVERRATKSPAQREAAKRRPLTKTAQINFRATPQFKALTELLASRLNLPVAETFVHAVNMAAKANGINLDDRKHDLYSSDDPEQEP